ncbi:hypothetical protein P885DRAFT_66944 [Corynascus similis CBS 632.67]
MCYEEFIAYQCGHRSMVVVRTCPMTTSGHNFPICGILPHKPHYAETMCTPCERQLHSRWVLIREWEHRWLHERGACGCEVIFPGLLNTPRVIGNTSITETTPSSTSAASSTPQEDDENNGMDATVSDGSRNTTPRTVQAGLAKTTSVGGHGCIPALFTEGVTSTGQHRVAVRLPGLYAAEWQADHAVLHERGRCDCGATFTPFRPQSSDDEMTQYDRETLRQWREREAAMEMDQHRALHRVVSQVDQTAQRIAEIKKTFGEFEIEDDNVSTWIDTPRLPAMGDRANQPAKIKDQDHHNYNNDEVRHTNRPIDDRRGKHLSSRRQSLSNQSRTPSRQLRGQLALTPRAPGSYNGPTTPTHQTYVHFPPTPSTLNTGMNMAMTTTYIHPDYSPYPHPSHHHPHPHLHPFAPAYPAYVTHTTFTDTIPSGASPWAVKPRPAPGFPWTTLGPGPYRTSGLVYGRGDSNNNNNNNGRKNKVKVKASSIDIGSDNGRMHRSPALEATSYNSVTASTPPAPAGAEPSNEQYRDNNQGQGEGKSRVEDTGTNTSATNILRICGLPIGAGPEGTSSHMPSWLDCPLRRSQGAVPLRIVGIAATRSDLGHDGDVQGERNTNKVGSGGRTEDGSQEEGREAEEINISNSNGRKGGDIDEGQNELMMPPSPPVRCHSAAT